jgi:hypothetical protein
MSIYHVIFTRQLSEDITVVLEKGLSPSAKTFIDQIAEEFEPHLVDGASLRMGSTYQKDDNGDNYVLEGFFTIPQPEIDSSARDAWEQRYAHLEDFLTLLRSAYHDGVAGLFVVESVQTGNRTILAGEIAAKAKQDRLSKGKDLLELSADEVFDRTKRQAGDIALITSGEFPSNGIHQNNTAYAVGKITEDGLFDPIRSHLRYGEAVGLFEKTCKAAELHPGA